MEEIRIKVKGGNLIVARNGDPDFDGVTVYLEMDNGDIIDVVVVECKAEKDFKELDVYNYEDKNSEEFTRKYIIEF